MDIPSPDYAYWLLHPHWKPEVAACLLIGVNPLAYYSSDPPPDQWMHYPADWKPAIALRGMDYEHQALLALIRQTGMTRPADLIRWRLGIKAATLSTPVPTLLAEWLDKQPLPNAGAPVPAAGPEKVRRSHVNERLEQLEQLFQDIEERAKKADIPYERSATPGDKNVLRQFIKQRDPELARMLNSAFADDLKALGVRFLPGNHTESGRKFFDNLYPLNPG
ncbi:MAG: hypothetical protein PHT19_10450 [Methylococcus sp.]|nr:hypothetical protein [Methylococcus sp.]